MLVGCHSGIGLGTMGGGQRNCESGSAEKAEDRLMKPTVVLNQLLEALVHPLYIVDVSDYRVTLANSVAKANGIYEGKTCHKQAHKSDRPCSSLKCPCPMDTVLHTKTPVTVEHIHFDEAGQSRVFEVHCCPIIGDDGEIREIIEYTIDITERRDAERSLQASESKFRELVENLNDVILAIDHEGMIRYISPIVKSILDYSPQDFIGRHCLTLPHDSDAERFKEYLEYIMKGRSKTDEFKVLSRKGKTHWFSISCRPMFAGEYIVGAQGVMMDITARVEARIEKEKLQQQLLQAQKMEAVGQLAGGIAHDFNNLLQAILGYTQLAISDLNDSDKQSRDLLEVEKAAEKAARLTRQLLTFSRNRALKTVDLSLNELIDNFANIIKRIIGEHIELSLDLSSDLAAVHADSGMLEQVMINLCVNARDAMPQGGNLTIRTENVQIDKLLPNERYGLKRGNHIAISVSDTGIGMSQDVKQRIFDPFFTTKEAGQGTGLGLSTVYGIVQEHNGAIHVYSEPNMGTTVRVYLPAVNRIPEQEDKIAAIEPIGGDETILLAEDDESVRSMVKKILTKKGYRVLTAQNGEEALLVLESQAENVDLAILDVIMPKMSGTDVYEHIKTRWPDKAVLFCSGYSDINFRQGFEFGPELPFIQKPYVQQVLLRKVREILDERKSIRIYAEN